MYTSPSFMPCRESDRWEYGSVNLVIFLLISAVNMCCNIWWKMWCNIFHLCWFEAYNDGFLNAVLFKQVAVSYKHTHYILLFTQWPITWFFLCVWKIVKLWKLNNFANHKASVATYPLLKCILDVWTWCTTVIFKHTSTSSCFSVLRETMVEAADSACR